MTIEPIGVVVIVIGLVCLALGYWVVSSTFVVATLFGSAAVMIVGSFNIQPAHFFLAFVALAALARQQEAQAAIKALRPPEPGFWLACLVALGVIGGVLLPRVFAGMTQIIPLGVSEYADTGSTVPLGPVSSNLTQSVYLVGDLVCFCLIVAVASTRGGFEAVLAGLIAHCAGNALLALLDLGTYASGTQGLLDPIRNARYTLHHEEQVYGLKRIVGSYTEASSFARATLGALSFAGTLWLCGYRPAWTGLLALASLILVSLSTSSTGLAGVIFVLAILYATAFSRCGLSAGARRSSAVVLFAPPLLVAATLIVLLDPQTSAAVRDYVEIVVLNKATTNSGLERASWNTVALQNFIDTWGVGVGLGTIRSSSFALALLANVGLIGTILYVLFFASAFLRDRSKPRTLPSDVRLAARNAALALLIGDLMVGPTVDQGLFFYILAGIASAQPVGRATRPPRDGLATQIGLPHDLVV